jgi:hypothetical protein
MNPYVDEEKVFPKRFQTLQKLNEISWPTDFGLTDSMS